MGLAVVVSCSSSSQPSCAEQLRQWRSPPVLAELARLPDADAARMMWAIPPPACYVNPWRWQHMMRHIANRGRESSRARRMLNDLEGG